MYTGAFVVGEVKAASRKKAHVSGSKKLRSKNKDFSIEVEAAVIIEFPTNNQALKTSLSSKTQQSSSVSSRQASASAGVSTIGAPAVLNDVFRIIGTPVLS